MCYNLISNTLEAMQYAQERGDYHLFEELQRKLADLEMFRTKKYFANGFGHPNLLTFTNAAPFEPQEMSLGLIPADVSNNEWAQKLRKKTLNAKAETLFEKGSYQASAKNKRCLIYVDGFYEYHDQDEVKYPFKITLKSGKPMIFAGIYSEWQDKKAQKTYNTVSIVTVEPPAGHLMAKIHNKPAYSETPRMPLILPKEKQNDWLSMPAETDEERKQLMALAVPFDDTLMSAHAVKPLIGKKGVGNSEAAHEPHLYDELLLQL